MKNQDAKLAAKLVEDLDAEDGDSEAEDEAEEMGDEEVVAQEVLDAFESGSASELSTALKAFFKLCKYEKESD